MKINLRNESAGVDHQLRWDGGQKIEWVSSNGSVREPEEETKTFAYPGPFTAAGKPYPNLKSLAVIKRNDLLYKDIYGRPVVCVSERFPCFDSYDYANENRYYRWFFIREKGKLTRVYYADERPKVEVTEDVASLENRCREALQKAGWLK